MTRPLTARIRAAFAFRRNRGLSTKASEIAKDLDCSPRYVTQTLTRKKERKFRNRRAYDFQHRIAKLEEAVLGDLISGDFP